MAGKGREQGERGCPPSKDGQGGKEKKVLRDKKRTQREKQAINSGDWTTG